MRRAHSIRSVVAVLAVFASCGPVPPPGTEVRSSKARLTQAAPQADLDQVVADTATFGFDVYRELAKVNPDNLAFSPYSVSTALAMTYAGARGDTQKAFEKVLHASLPADRFHRAMNTIDAALARRGQAATSRGKPFRLQSTNQLFAHKGLTVQPDYLDLLATEYGAGVRLLDFAKEPEPSRKAINAWVNVNTNALIPELLRQGTISSDTRLTLVNALYFNAGWLKPFDKAKTVSGPFTKADGSTVQVPMMASDELSAKAGALDGVDVVELPYDGDEIALLILMPPSGKLATFEAGLTGAKLAQLAAAATTSASAVRLPKFQARTQAELTDVLKALGLGVAFEGAADFSGMTTAEALQITAVVHEAFVKTDEDGTEAAAATAVVVGRVSAPQYVEVNRAFVYVIRDRATGAALFVGRVNSP